MQDYATARSVGKAVAAFGWLAVLVGVLMIVAATEAGGLGFGLFAVAPALAMIVGGFLMVAQGQLLQAQVDVAANTAELINLMRAANQSRPTPAKLQSALKTQAEIVRSEPISSSAAIPTKITLEKDYSSERAALVPGRGYNYYRGWNIKGEAKRGSFQYHTAGYDFSSLEEAANHIDKVERQK